MWGVKDLLLILSIQMNLETSTKKTCWFLSVAEVSDILQQLLAFNCHAKQQVDVWDKVTCSLSAVCIDKRRLVYTRRTSTATLGWFFSCKEGLRWQYYPILRPNPQRQLIPGSPSTCVRVWMKRISGASGGGVNSRWQGCPRHVCFLGENNASLRALIKGGEGDLSPRTAGRQRASHPPLSLRVHTQTHTLQLTGTGHGLNIYQAHANKGLLEKIKINLCLSYMTALFSSLR